MREVRHGVVQDQISCPGGGRKRIEEVVTSKEIGWIRIGIIRRVGGRGRAGLTHLRGSGKVQIRGSLQKL